MLIRLTDSDVVTREGRETWGPEGYVAFSKVCTHAGCPVGLYQQQFKKLLCPCHQSTFDVPDGASVSFGPATRPLPQLPLEVDDGGFLRAQSDYQEPIGPGFWDRGTMIVRRLARWIDERLGTSKVARSTLNKVFPDHWSFMLGEIALYLFVILLLTGVYLTFFFVPGSKEVTYDGSYVPLRGVVDVAGVRVGAAHQLRRARRPRDAPDPPLGGAAVRRVDRRPPHAHLLHRARSGDRGRSTGSSA